jgi:transposase
MTRRAYKSDLTDQQWRLIEPLIPPAKLGGHPRTVNMRSCSQWHLLSATSLLFMGDATP